jgi:excinuclease ABC subunit C
VNEYETVQSKLDNLPAKPGVYAFKGRDGSLLYVGKASSLRSRVRSYFQAGSGDQRFFIARLQAELGDLETFVTATEKEAALLENSLIKQYQPCYNFKLRDDKDYLSLKLDPTARWPRLELVRRPKKDGARYFGPYHSATAARSTLRLANRFFRLRTCTDRELKSRARPCLQQQIGRCPGPCALPVEEQTYAEQVKMVMLFLEGRHDELVQSLTQKMTDCSRALQYELAAVYRDQIQAVDSVLEPQRVSLVLAVDQDFFGYFRQEDKAELVVLMARHGRVMGVRSFAEREVTVPDDELVASFVTEYYGRGSYIPDEVALPVQVEAMEGLAEVLSEQRGSRVAMVRPQRGAKAHLLRLAMENAAHAFEEKARAREDLETKLGEMMRQLALTKPPRRLECVDISHSSGAETVAVVVAFEDGEPNRRRYRSFHVREAKAADDYAAMYEVLSRRFSHGREAKKGWELPDLLVVDGGKGQLGIAQSALSELGLVEVPVVALAKEKQTLTGEALVDRVYVPGRKNPVELRAAGGALNVLARARDEAHRASNALRLKVGKRRTLRSSLDEIPGLGPKTRTRLLRALGSVTAIQSAGREELIAAGASKPQAEAIYNLYHQPEPTDAGEPSGAKPEQPEDHDS